MPESRSLRQDRGDYVANRSRSCKINGAPVSALAWSLTGDEGWILVFDPPAHGQILEALSALKDAYGVIATTAPTRETLRIEAPHVDHSQAPLASAAYH